MKAKRMFEKLGYTLCEYDDDFVRYTKQFQPGNFVEVKFVIWNRAFEVQHTYAGRTNSVCISTEMFKAICKQCEELGWGDNKPQEETNFEHYNDFIVDFLSSNLALENGVPVKCEHHCSRCNLDKKSCGKKIRKWLGEVHKKPLFKLTQFEYDLIHTYSDCDENCKFDDCEQLKRLKDKGYFKQIDDDELIENILMSCEVSE